MTFIANFATRISQESFHPNVFNFATIIEMSVIGALGFSGFWATVCKAVRRSYRTVVCLPLLFVCLSKSLVNCGPTVR